jgi:hypothetical protein
MAEISGGILDAYLYLWVKYIHPKQYVVEIFVVYGGIIHNIQENLHCFWTSSEHDFGAGGDSGGIL